MQKKRTTKRKGRESKKTLPPRTTKAGMFKLEEGEWQIARNAYYFAFSRRLIKATFKGQLSFGTENRLGTLGGVERTSRNLQQMRSR